jgi:hypothetical protein
VKRPTLVAAATFAFVLFPSLGIVQKFLGTRAAIAYAIVGCVASGVAGWRSASLRAPLNDVDPRWSRSFSLLSLIAAAALFVIVFPMANSGSLSSGVRGGGSDRDEALQVGGEALLAREFPYYRATHLGNPISQMPGSLLVALPFAAVGHAALQNVVWLPVFWLAVRRRVGSPSTALLIVLTLFGACPAVAHDFLTGGDLVTNSIIILVASLWLIAEVDHRAPAWRVAVAAAVLGLALSSRASFWLMLPVLHAALARRGGLARSTGALVVATVACAAVTAPFFLYDPAGFTPLTSQNRFAVFGETFPRLPILGPLVCAACSVGLAWLAGVRRVSGVLMASGTTMLLPSVTMVLLASARDGLLNFYFATYALPSTIFGGLGLALWVDGQDHSGTAKDGVTRRDVLR